MCGIAGFQGHFEPTLLERMAASLHHRGPDDQGVEWIEKDRVGFAHRRLSIIDLSPLGHQPMYDQGKRALITYNGELYNYRELREELRAKGYVFRSASDTEVILNLYLEHGVDMLAKMNGIFAFAIWDLAARRMFLARDQLGVKPLYYMQTPQGFVFASEIKALACVEGFDRSIDHSALYYHLAYLWSPAPHTMFKQVKKLEPGCALLIEKGTVARWWRYYDVPYTAEPDHLPVEEAIRLTRQTLETAVRRQMVSDAPLGAFLSGGLDSSAVVAMAARETGRGKKLTCYTIEAQGGAFAEEGFIDDLPFAKAAAKRLDVDLRMVKIGPEMATHLERMIYHLDEPHADPAPINAMLISRMAREEGIKVLLSGGGGDDIFSGYRRHFAIMMERYWAWAPKGFRSFAARRAKSISSSSALGRRLAKVAKLMGRTQDERIAGLFSWLDEDVLDSLVGGGYGEEARRGDPLRASLNRLPGGVHPLNRMLYLDTKHFLADHNLGYLDKMCMAEGVEARVPLLDPDLVALAARLPVSFKQKGREGKWIFKKAMEPYLPKEVIYRPKTGFGAPLRRWLNHDLKELLEDTLSEDALRRRGLFDATAARQLIKLNQSGAVDAAYPIFALLCMELWLRIFVDQRRN